ncbi:hypothetical protein BDV09DRAFT_198511 [Aspergillus tetrazonus]
MDLAYNLAVKQNRQFKFIHTFVASDMDDLARSLNPARINGRRDALPQRERPVVLCIGGQNGTTVHLDSNSTTAPRFFRDIWTPATEPYACAKSWIDSGLKFDTIIGHSFGQLTALVVAAAVSLLDGLRLVSERARLIQEAWGHETGDMLSVQASVGTVTGILEDDEHYPASAVDIACVNGPEAIVLAGDRTSVSIMEQRLQRAGLKTARLRNTHAFHSRLVDPILPRWREIVQSCHFAEPPIRIEACAESQDWSSFFSFEDVFRHSREPVYFHQAVARVATRLKDSVWVDAGGDIFQPLDLRGRDALSAFSRAICNLWAAGTRVQHWCFHQNEYNWINLPPYSFEKTSHWLDYVSPAAIVAINPKDTSSPVIERPRELLELVETGIQETTYRVNCLHPLFMHCTKGHAVLGQALCPASLYVELATQAAARELQPLKVPTSEGSSVRELKMLSLLSISSHCSVYIRLSQNAHGRTAWQFTVLSGEGNGVISMDPGSSILPATKMHSHRRLASQVKASSLSSCPDSNILQGKNIYRTFGQVVNYASYYRGVEQIVSRENESVGLVRLQHGNTPGLNETAVDPVLLDNFLQVAGIHVNCLSDRADDEVYICTELGYLALSDSFTSSWRENPAWNYSYEVPGKSSLENQYPYSRCATFCSRCVYNRAPAERAHLAPLVSEFNQVSTSTSINSTIQQVCELLSSILEVPVSEISPTSTLIDIGIDSLLSTEILSEIMKHFGTTIPASEFISSDTVSSIAYYLNSSRNPPLDNGRSGELAPVMNGTSKTGLVFSQVQEMLGEILEVPICEIKPTSSLSDIGIDSLLATEVLNENRTRFAVPIPVDQFQEFGTVKALASYMLQQGNFNGEGSEILSERSIEEVQSTKSLAAAGQESFATVRQDMDFILPETQFAGFCKSVLPLQKELVVAYLVEAFESLGCSLTALHAGQRVPNLTLPTKHHEVKKQIYYILDDAGIIQLSSNGHFVRTATAVPRAQAEQLHATILSRFPQHANEHRLLASTGSKLAACLIGDIDPLGILFGQQFEYTFSDISPSLVAAARKKFTKYKFMQSTVVNIENDPPAELVGQYDIIISTNCIHATKDLVTSCTNIRRLLLPDGILCLVELTRNLFWFDLVFGLLDGWWRFQDGRQHALANEHLWRKYLTQSGFQWVDWTVGESEESDILRVITASSSELVTSMETVEFDRVDGLSLEADIYYPNNIVAREKAFSVALMIHGGGHIMLSRKDIRPQQTQMLLERGFIPISVDYRLCPETTLPDGPMRDVCTALSWIQTVLPTLPLKRPDIRIDPDYVVAVGWSTGGHLALTLGFMAPQRGIRPPDAILAFYCPLDYEDPFWTRPKFPFGHRPDSHSEAQFNNRAGLYKRPITAYNVPASNRALAGWTAPSNPRSQIALLMNQKGRALQILLNGLSLESDEFDSLPMPTLSQIRSISPLAQIRNGMYRTPTFIIHGTRDDLIPVDRAITSIVH